MRQETGVDAADGTGADEGQGAPRWLVVSLGICGALVVGACGLLWLRFGTQVFLDAATNLWKTCF